MEPNSKKEPTYRELSNAASAFSFWSRRSIQGLVEGGYLKDFAQAVRSKGFDLNKACARIKTLEQFGCEYDEPVSLKQAMKVILQAPTDNFEEIFNFLSIITTLSANSKFFEGRPFSWETRDLIRTLIGLPSLHTVHKNGEGEEVLFRMTGRCPIWAKAPKGYRYAGTWEIPIQAVQDLDCVVAFIPNHGWSILKKQGQDIHPAGKVNEQFFLTYDFCIPLVKTKK